MGTQEMTPEFDYLAYMRGVNEWESTRPRPPADNRTPSSVKGRRSDRMIRNDTISVSPQKEKVKSVAKILKGL